MRYHVTVGGRSVVVDLTAEGVLVDGEPVAATLAREDGSPVRGLLVDGRSLRVLADRRGAGRWRIELAGTRLDVDVVDERTRVVREMAGGGAAPAGPRPIVAPMPGMVVKVEVSEGDVVAEGQGVAIVEAMKMENELRASGSGVVQRVHVCEGDAVEKDQILVELAPLPEEEG